MKTLNKTVIALTGLLLSGSVLAEQVRIIVSAKPHFTSNFAPQKASNLNQNDVQSVALDGQRQCLNVGSNGQACFKLPTFNNLQKQSVMGLQQRTIQHANRFKAVDVDYQNMTKAELIKAFKAMGIFETVEFDIVLKSNVVPNDTFYHFQPYLENESAENPHAMNFEKANDLVPDDAPTVGVVVIDGGFHLHDDMPYAGGYNFLDFDADGNPSIPNPIFYDIEDETHGVGVASVIGAIRNNEFGMAGAAKNVDVFAAVDGLGISGSLFLMSKIINWASGIDSPEYQNIPSLSSDIKVINISAGGYAGLGDDGIFRCPTYLTTAITNALESGITIVASAGNDSRNGEVHMPSSCGGVVSVGASDGNNNIADYSNFGISTDLMARGSNVARLGSDNMNDAFGSFGTSFSAPLVSASLALVAQVAPNLSYETKLRLLKFTAQPIETTECETKGCGAGLLDAGALVEAAISFNSGSISTIKHALSDKTECQNDWYLDNFGASARLCELYKVNFFGGLSNTSNTYKLSKIAKGVAFNAHLNDSTAAAPELVLSTQEPDAFIRDFDNAAYDYAFQFCKSSNGELQCEAEYTALDTTEAIQPEACN
ncbi:MAG: S8 family serine peptidase [Shewanella sp.]|nr:S8 family serine peptidase [Shewanella sp.]